MVRRSALEIVEGSYAAALVSYCYRAGVFTALTHFRAAEAVASELRLDAGLLQTVLNFLYHTTKTVERRSGPVYRTGTAYQHYTALGYHLDKFLVAYGGLFSRLDDVLRSPEGGARLVNGVALAGAFRQADSGAPRALVGILREVRAQNLLELGCGTAPMSRALASSDRSFVAWGVDANRSMCTAARSCVKREGLTRRIRIFHSNVNRLEKALPKSVRAGIDTLYAQSLLNAYCHDHGRPAVVLLRKLSRLFPQRRLFIADYFGRLGTTRNAELHTILQDLVQALSNQGVPPRDHHQWLEIYAEAGCSLEKAYEGHDDGINWFMHDVRL